MAVQQALATGWANEPGLRERCLRWSWFRAAFVASLPASPAAAHRIDEDSLARAFFSWAESVEVYAAYEALDPVDFRHFIAGLLLQQLLAAAPLPDAPRRAATPALTGFVLTLLQALHADAGSAPLRLDPAELEGLRWASFIENVAEDSSMAGCFLDRMAGLAPTWQSRSLVEHRPAMRRALEQRQRA